MNNLINWYQASQELKALKETELELRKLVVGEYFQELQEGTNRVDVPGDAQLVAVLPYNYSLDEEEIAAGLEHVPKAKRDTLIVYKPSLVKSVYNSLSKKAQGAFTAQCVTIKPGTPSLSIDVKKQ